MRISRAGRIPFSFLGTDAERYYKGKKWGCFLSQMLSRGEETVVYADDPEREEMSNGSAEDNGSNILGVEGVARGMPLISATSNAIVFATVVLSVMLATTTS